MAVSTAFGDLRDSRFKKIFYERFDELPSMLKEFFNFQDSGVTDQTRRDEWRDGLGETRRDWRSSDPRSRRVHRRRVAWPRYRQTDQPARVSSSA